MRAVLEFYNHKWAFPPHFGNIEPSLQSLEDGKTAQENLLENLRAKRNVRNIIFHHGISPHCCGLPWVSRRNFATLQRQASNQRGCVRVLAPGRGWGEYVEGELPAQECRLLWVCDTNPPKPSSNALGSWVGCLWEAHLPLFFFQHLPPATLPKSFSSVPRLGLLENQMPSFPETSTKDGIGRQSPHHLLFLSTTQWLPEQTLKVIVWS